MRFHPLLLSLCALGAVVPIAVSAQTTESPFEFHAALNAGAGKSNSLPILGIPSYATYDYRNAMLQFRYKSGDHDQFVVQLLNRRLGISPLQAALPDVTLQWGFWQRKTDYGTFKVGRAPMPRGIFNEIRFVGTVLPFYRPSFEIYGEGRETVDGVVYTKRTPIGGGYSVDFNAFGGSNEVRTQVITATGNSIRAFRGNSLKGVQGWFNIPTGESRLGAYYSEYKIDADTSRGTRGEILLSAETHVVPRSVIRAEALHIYGTNPNQDRKSVSGEAVFEITEKLSLSTQYSRTNNRIFQKAPASNVDVIATRDIAFGGTYRIGGGALIRLEHHEVHGYAFDKFVPIITTVGATTTVAPPSFGAYWLASFAVSF